MDYSPETASPHERTRDRRTQILAIIDESEFVSVRELAESFGLTEMSIRRDLNTMELDGEIARVRGGATRPRVAQASKLYARGAQRNVARKQRIAKAAIDLIPADSVVFFYSGSTVARVASSLGEAQRSSLTIVTNSLPIINEVSSWDDPHLVAIGGTYLAPYMAFVGPQALASVAPLNADVAIIGCDGLTAERGLTTPHQLVASIGASIVSRAQRKIVVADSSKVGRTGFTPIAAISEVDVLVTDDEVDARHVKELKDLGIEVIVT